MINVKPLSHIGGDSVQLQKEGQQGQGYHGLEKAKDAGFLPQ
nr:hypothetical protein [Comamonas jiangduensis]